MADFIRNTTFGQTVRLLSGKRFFLHPEEKLGFVLPPEYQHSFNNEERSALRGSNVEAHRSSSDADGIELHNTKSLPIAPVKTSDGTILVDCVQAHFRVGNQTVLFGLSMFVLTYGVGPLFFGPITEVPVVGFFGSVGIAIGDSSAGDVVPFLYFPYDLVAWILAFWWAPPIGTMSGGFAAMAHGWRWPMWLITWWSAPMLLMLLRAQRLRALTGDSRLQSQGELDQRGMTATGILMETLIRPFEIAIQDPAVAYVHLYTAFFYGVFFCFFEVFPLVFIPIFGFNLGEIGLVFQCCGIGATIATVFYFLFLRYYMIPNNVKNGFDNHEQRLIPALAGSVFTPIGLFIFAWTYYPYIHWIAPMIGVVTFCVGICWIIMALFTYVPVSYTQYTTLIYTSNGLARSMIACSAVHIARPLFINMGTHEGVTILACLNVLGIPATWYIYKKGAQLRAKSRFAQG
ncbi:MFS general substrate transporter [Trichoderma austrokoningii]